MQLHIELRCFAQSILDATDLRHLTSNMEMNQTKTVLHFIFFQEIERLQQFARGQTELAGITTALFPFSTS